MAKIICQCFNISDEQLVSTYRSVPIESLDDFMKETGAGGACGQCKIDLQRILEKEAGHQREMEDPNV